MPGFAGRYRALYPLLRPMIRQIWRDSRGVVANSAGLRELALRSAPRQAIEVIPNGIDTEKFRRPTAPTGARRSASSVPAA